MTRAEALKLLRGGKKGIAKWNRLRDTKKTDISLINVDLSGAYLRRAELFDVDFVGTNLLGADLRDVDSHCACFNEAILIGADLRNAHLGAAQLCSTELRSANLRVANLRSAVLLDTDLCNADLRGAELPYAMLNHCQTTDADLAGSHWGSTLLGDVDLGKARGLDSVVFEGPSSIGIDTLVRSAGQVPESFLRGCGFQPWQIIQAKMYDPSLTRDQFTDLQYQVNIARNQGPLFIGGVFISYSHDDTGFVDKMHDRLDGEGVPVWLDRHDMVAGDLQKQISRAIRLNDVVLLVLSESSVKSDWVEHELEMARKKEQDEGRDVLCPVALDDAWKAKTDDVLWRQVKKKNVLDFSKWNTEAFGPAYQKLTAGLKVNYGPATGGAASDTK